MQEKLLIMRRRAGLSQVQMADLIGVSPNTYNHKENGIKQFKANEMFKIADYFHLKIEDIFLPYVDHNGVENNKKEV